MTSLYIPQELITVISRYCSRPVSPALHALVDTILQRHGETARAVLYYGSCLRSGKEFEGLVDLYLLVDNYREAFTNRTQAVLSRLLPPNVFYLELTHAGRVLRAKYAVVSLSDFERGTSPGWFHSYLWGRFAQPTGLLYASSAQVVQQVQRALGQAVLTFIRRVVPMLAPCFTARSLWHNGLLLTYRAELRAEHTHNLIRLIDAAPDYYEQITQAALAGIPYPLEASNNLSPASYRARIPDRIRHFSRFTWGLRCLQGKMLSILRLLKGLTTFQGGVDYILWKIRRHTGISIELEPRLKRFPLVANCIIFWRLYRRGAFR